MWVPEQERTLVFLVNHLGFGPTAVAPIYRERWQIELLLKVLKQNLCVKTFVGTSANALHRIGFIEEHFFAYGEENDFQIRARKAGYRVVAINVPVWRHGEASFGRQRRRVAALKTRNNIQLLIKHRSLGALGRSAWQLMRPRTLARSPRHSTASAVERRLRSSSVLVNIGMLIYGALWNLGHYRGILVRRVEDNKRAARSRELPQGEPTKRA